MLYLQGHQSVTSVKMSRAVGFRLPVNFACKPGRSYNPLARVTLGVGLPYLLVNRALVYLRPWPAVGYRPSLRFQSWYAQAWRIRPLQIHNNFQNPLAIPNKHRIFLIGPKKAFCRYSINIV